MYCWKCGEQVSDDALFCKKCGARLQNKKEDLQDHASKTSKQNRSTSAKTSGFKKSGLIVLIAVILLLTSFGIWKMSNRPHSEDSSPTAANENFTTNEDQGKTADNTENNKKTAEYPLNPIANEKVTKALKLGKTVINITKYGRPNEINDLGYRLHTNDVNEFISKYSNISEQTTVEYDRKSNTIICSIEYLTYSASGNGIEYIDDYQVIHDKADVLQIKYNENGLPESEEYLYYNELHYDLAPVIQITGIKSGIVVKTFDIDGLILSEDTINENGRYTERISYMDGLPWIRNVYEVSEDGVDRLTTYMRDSDEEEMKLLADTTYIKEELDGLTKYSAKQIDGSVTSCSYYQNGVVIKSVSFYSDYDILTEYIYEGGLLARKEVYYMLNDAKQYLIGVTTYSYK